jgi:prophage tail gpP-like protein
MADDLTLRVSTCTLKSSWAPGELSYTTSNARSITGWTQVRVSRGIERCPSDFEIEFTEPYADVSSVVVQPGDQCEVFLGADLVLTGFVDRYMPSYNARTHTIRISGRSRCQDLVDCSAKWTGLQFLAQPVLSIAQQLCAAYGVPVALAPGTDQGEPIPQLNIMVGEPIYDVLERLCRFRAMLLYDQPDGSLLLAGIGTTQAASGFTEGVNVLSASAMYGMDGRFSRYDATQQSLDTCQDIGEGGNLIATAYDTGVPRFRYRAVVSEQVLGGNVVAVQREMARRVGRSFQFQVVTDSWRDAAGVLYTPNTFVPLVLPGLKMTPKTWLISDVTYMRDEGGTTCALTVMPPDAFLQEPIILNPVAPDINPGN